MYDFLCEWISTVGFLLDTLTVLISPTWIFLKARPDLYWLRKARVIPVSLPAFFFFLLFFFSLFFFSSLKGRQSLVYKVSSSFSRDWSGTNLLSAITEHLPFFIHPWIRPTQSKSRATLNRNKTDSACLPVVTRACDTRLHVQKGGSDGSADKFSLSVPRGTNLFSHVYKAHNIGWFICWCKLYGFLTF